MAGLQILVIEDKGLTPPEIRAKLQQVGLDISMVAATDQEAVRALAEIGQRVDQERVQTLQAATQALTATLDLHQVLERILTELRRVVPYDSATVQQLQGENLVIVGGHGFPNPEQILGLSFSPAEKNNPNQGIVRTRAPLILEDAPAVYAEFGRGPHAPAGIRSWLGVPLLFGDRLIGMLALDKREPGFYSHDHARLAMAFAAQAAIAIENARLFQAEREQRELAEALRQATTAISSTLDLEQVLDQILDQLNRVVPSDAANVMLIEANEARVVRWRGYDRFGDPEFLNALAFDLTKTADLRHVYETQAPIVVPDTSQFVGWVHIPEQNWLRSCAVAPICVRDQVIGFLGLDSATPFFFNQTHAERLRIFADQASLALEHARLYKVEQQRAAEAAAISAIAQALNATTDIESVFQAVARELHHVVDFDRLSLALFTEGGQSFVMYALTDPDGGPLQRNTIMPLTATAAAQDIEAGQPHLTPDLALEIDFPGERALYNGGLRSRLNLPLVLGQTVIGALNLASFKPKAFAAAQLSLLSQVADAVAAAVQSARFYQEISDRNRELMLLNRIIAASVASQKVESILETACHELALAFSAPQSIALLLNQERTEAVVVAEYAAQGRPSALGQIILAADLPFCPDVPACRAPLVIQNAQTDPRLSLVRDWMARRGIISVLVLPLLVQDETIGCLSIEASEPRSFSEKEVDLAWRVAEQVSGSLARARLIETQKRLSTAVEQTAEAVVITDTEGHALYANPAFERITGRSQAMAVGSMPGTWTGDPAVDTFHASQWPAATASQPWKDHVTGTRPDGSLYTVDLTVTPVHDEAGCIVNYVATLHDVTREIRLEEQFYQAQKMEALGQLAGGIAHDFNNLLTVIRLSTQLLRRQLHPQDPLLEHVLRLEETGERATSLIQQLLRFSRREITEPRLINVNELVNELGNMLRRIIGETIQLRTNLTENLWPVRVDPSQMDQVILNLVVNARDAMPQGGVLTIETSNVFLDQAYADAHVDTEPGKHILLAISDTGIGMDDKVKSHLFEPFFTTKKPGQGTGLGLATVFGIIKQSHGHIQVSSRVNQGTAFNIYLPCAGESEERTLPQPPPALAEQPVRGTETVLIVEDKAEVRSLAAQVLESCGYQVLVAEHGLEALQISREHPGPIHLLLTDVVMPYLSGVELAAKMIGQRPQIRVLFMSGYNETTLLRPEHLEFPPVLLAKPFTVEELAQKVRTVLHGEG